MLPVPAMAADARATGFRARTRVWMNGVKDKIWFLREGLFAKYVVSLVGLVVFVLAVNGAMETWISYRATRIALTDAMGEKAGGHRAADRAIGRRTGAADLLGDPRQLRHARKAPRRLRATLEPGAAGEPAVAARRPGPRAIAAVAHRGDGGRQPHRFLPRPALYRSRQPRRQLRAGRFPGFAAHHVDLGLAFRIQCRRHRRRDRAAFSVRPARRSPGRQGRVRLCGRRQRPGAGEFRQGA